MNPGWTRENLLDPNDDDFDPDDPESQAVDYSLFKEKCPDSCANMIVLSVLEANNFAVRKYTRNDFTVDFELDTHQQNAV